MLGIIFSFLAGIFVTLQGVFNTRVGEKIGFFETTAFVHATGLVFAIVTMLIWGNGNFKGLRGISKLYLLGGVFGVIIIYTVMKGISLVGATYSTIILLITQLVFATIIDTYGLFGNTQIKFDFTKLLGLVVIIAGIIIFKLKG